MDFTKEQLDVINPKCPICGAVVEYRKGNPDFLSCPNYSKCGAKAHSAQVVIMLQRRYIAELKSKMENN